MVKFTSGFNRTFYDGEYVELDLGGMVARATVYLDNHGDKPDECEDGFWPSLDPDSAGFIGIKGERDGHRLTTATRKAQRIMDAWERHEWFYVGVAVTIHCGKVQMTGQYDHACWGVGCNYPVKVKGHRNRHIMDIANEELGAALREAMDTVENIYERLATAAA